MNGILRVYPESGQSVIVLCNLDDPAASHMFGRRATNHRTGDKILRVHRRDAGAFTLPRPLIRFEPRAHGLPICPHSLAMQPLRL